MADADGNSRGVGLGLAGVVAGLAVFALQPARKTDAQGPPAAVEAARPPAQKWTLTVESAPAATDPHLQPFRDHARTTAARTSADPPSFEEARAALHGQYDFKCLIALLPDPYLSRLGYRFDLMLESVERALETQGYVIDHWWLPWRFGPATAGAGRGGEVTITNPAARPEHFPGVILFRQLDSWKKKRDGKPGLIALLTVGELPTAGAHRSALRRALDLATGVAADGTDKAIRVLGPCFTGSRPSIEAVVTAWLKAAPAGRKDYSVHVVSGGATGLSGQALTAPAEAVQAELVRANPNYKPTQFKFETTLHHDDQLHLYLLDHLKRQESGRAAKVAMLVEANTAFGASTAGVIFSGELRGKDPEGENPKGSHTSVRAELQKRLAEHGELVLPFPLHVSQVRNVYNRQRLAEDQSLPRLPGPTSRLRIPFDDPADVRDIVPPLTGEMTAAWVELLIAQTVATIAREGVRYVGIVATDTRDKIFLASMIKEYAPDVQVFTTVSDLMLAHPDYLPYTQGVLVASTYPLAPANQEWSWPYHGHRRRYQFAHQSHLGTYNATLVLLDDPADPPDRRAARGLIEYGPPLQELDPAAEAGCPPVWLSVIGRRGPWPVSARPAWRPDVTAATPGIYHVPRDVLDPVEGDIPRDALDRAERLVPQTTSLWKFLTLGSLVAAGVVVYTAARPGPVGRRRDRSGLLEWLHPPGANPAGPGWHAALVGGLCLVIAVGFGLALPVLAVPLRVGWAIDGRFQAWPLLLSAADVAVVVAAVAVAGRKFAEAARRQLRLPVGIAVGVVGVGLMFTWLFTLGPDGVQRQVFAFDRTILLWSGLSPAVPTAFLLAAVAAWLVWQLSHVALFDESDKTRPAAPYDGRATGKLTLAADELQDGVRNWGGTEWWRERWRWAVVVVAAAVLLHVWVRFLPTVDGRVFDYVALGGIVLVSALIVHAGIAFLAFWKRVRRLLKQLHRLPMMAAYDRLPAKISELLMSRSDGARQAVERHQRQLLRTFDDTRRSGLPPGWPAAPPAVAEADDYAVVQADLDRAAKDCLAALKAHWDGLPGWYAFGPVPDKLKDAAARSAYPPDAVLPTDPTRPPDAGPPPGADDARRWLGLAEDVVATHTVSHLSPYFIHLRRSIVFVTAAAVLLVLAVGAYPFQPARVLSLWTWGLALTVGGVAMTYIVQLDRDPFVSRVTKTVPNRVTLDRDFLSSVGAYILPLSGALLIQLPSVGEFLRSVLDPLLRTVK